MVQHLKHPHHTRLPKWVACNVIGNIGEEGGSGATIPSLAGILSLKKIPGFTPYRPLATRDVGGLGGIDPPLYFYPMLQKDREYTYNTTVSDAGNITTTVGISPHFGGSMLKLWISGAGIEVSPNTPLQIMNHCGAPGRGLGGAIFFNDASTNLLNPNHNGGYYGQRTNFGDDGLAAFSVVHGAPMVYYKVQRGQADCGAFIETHGIPVEWDSTGIQSGHFSYGNAAGGDNTPLVVYRDIRFVQKLWLDWQNRTGLIKCEMSYILDGFNLEIEDQFASIEVPITHFRYGFDKVYFYDVSTGVGPDLMTGVESGTVGVNYDDTGGNYNLTVRTDLTVITDSGSNVYTEASLCTGANGGMIYLADGTETWSLGDSGAGLELAVGYYHSNFLKAGNSNTQYGSYAMLQAGRAESVSPSNDENATDTAILDHAYGWEGSQTGFDYIPGGKSSYTTFISYGSLTKVADDMDWLNANGY